MIKRNALDGLIKWSGREEWDELFDEVLDAHFGQACDDFKIEFEKLPELIGEAHFMALWGCAFEDFLTQPRAEDDEETVVDDYLKRRGWKESATNKRYMEALRDSLMSLYEVSDIVPGQSMLLRDLILGGDPVRVIEHSATQRLKIWDRIGARVVQVSGQYRMSGGLLRFRPEAATELLDEMQDDMKEFRREFKKRAKSAGLDSLGLAGPETADLAYLMAAASVFSDAWLDDTLSRLLGERPPVLNSDGDELSFHVARFAFAPGTTTEMLRARLDGMDELAPTDKDFWNWVEAPVAARADRKHVKLHSRIGNSLNVTLEDGSKVLGSIELKDGTLVMETNSSRRAALGSDMLKLRLGALVETPQITARSLDRLLQESKGSPKPATGSGLSPEQAAAVVGRMMDSHYRAVLDEPLQMLGGATPRAAAKSKSGQRKVAEWLKYLENQSADKATAGEAASYDFGWMWDELRIAHLRK